MSDPLEIFVSYSHRDEELMQELATFTKPMERYGYYQIWHDGRIEVGQTINQTIASHLDVSQIVLLLVSADYLASDYCYSVEMERAVERHDEGLARVIPIILRPCDWHSTPFGKLKACPKDGKPITSWNNRDEALTDVVREIKRVLIGMRSVMDPEIPRRAVPLAQGTAVPATPLSMTTQDDVPKSDRGLAVASPAAGGLNSPLRFYAFTEPVHVRSEGMTELIGDIFLECRYVADAPPIQELWFSVRISFGTTVTSGFTSYFGRLSGDPVIVEIGRRSTFMFLRSSKVEANYVAFDHIPLDDIQPNEKRVFRIGNIRCNASALAWAAASTGQIYAAISVGTMEIPTQVVATIGDGLRFAVSRADGCKDMPFITSQATNLHNAYIASIRYAEGFRNAFKARALQHLSVWDEWDVGRVCHSESYAQGPVFQTAGGRLVGILADHGTRFRAQFSNLPTGLRLYISTEAVRSPIHAELVEFGSKLSIPFTIDGIEVRELSIVDGRGLAVWEVTNSPRRTDGPAYSDFAIFISYEAQPEQNLPTPGVGLVNGSFSPAPPEAFTHASGGRASESLTIPRFVDLSRGIPIIHVIL